MDLNYIEETENMGENEIVELDAVNSVTDDERIVFYVQRLKLAVAIAVIQSCPHEMSPEAYATFLVQSCIDDNNKWKSKYETLERNIFILEQKVQTAELKEKLNISDMNVDLLTTDIPPSSSLQLYSAPSLDLRTRISSTMEFVRCYILLGSVSDKKFENHKENEKLKGTVLRSISLFFEYLSSLEGLSVEFGIVKCAIEEVCRLFDSKANDFEKDLIKLCMNFVEKLLLDIFQTFQINMVEYQHRRSMQIQMISEQKKLTALILSRLLREITIISDSFVTCLQSPTDDFSPLLKMENAYYVLQTAEGVLHIMRQHKSALDMLRIPKVLVKEWNKTTEKSLLELSSHFPLYCIYVWHTKTLLKSVLESDDGI